MKHHLAVSLTVCLLACSSASWSLATAAAYADFAEVSLTNGEAALSWLSPTQPVTVRLEPAESSAIKDVDYCVTRDGKVCVVWTEATTNGSDVFAQQFTSEGVPRWGDGHVPVSRFRGHQRNARVAPALDGGVFVVWESDSAGSNNINLWCQRLLPNGRLVWEIPVPVCTHPGNQQAPAIAPDPEGGIIIAWEDYRFGSADIFGQRIEYDGSPLDQEDGVEVEVAPGEQTDVRFVFNELGRPVSLQWNDHRPGFDAPVRVETDLAALPIPEPALTPLLALAALALFRRWAAR
jgi:hypothetical protein